MDKFYAVYSSTASTVLLLNALRCAAPGLARHCRSLPSWRMPLSGKGMTAGWMVAATRGIAQPGLVY